jgi:ribose 5-phosphate isomerase
MPARKKKKRSLRLDAIVLADWDNILKEVDKKEIPVELLETVIINFVDGSQVTVNIQEMLEEGMNPEQIETRLNDRLTSLNNVISDVDFHVLKEKIIATVSPTTKRLLKKVP